MDTRAISFSSANARTRAAPDSVNVSPCTSLAPVTEVSAIPRHAAASDKSVALRSQAIARLQKGRPEPEVSFTLPVMPCGLDPDGTRPDGLALAESVSSSPSMSKPARWDPAVFSALAHAAARSFASAQVVAGSLPEAPRKDTRTSAPPFFSRAVRDFTAESPIASVPSHFGVQPLPPEITNARVVAHRKPGLLPWERAATMGG